MRALLAISILLVAAGPATAEPEDPMLQKLRVYKATMRINDATDCVHDKAAEYGATSNDPAETVADGVLEHAVFTRKRSPSC